MTGCYQVTNSTIKLITSAVGMTSQSIMTSQTEESLECCVQFVMSEIFSSFVDWLKTDFESWNEIGLFNLYTMLEALNFKIYTTYCYVICNANTRCNLQRK